MQFQATHVTTSTRSSMAGIRVSARPACAVPLRRKASDIQCDARSEGENRLQTLPQRIAIPLAAAIAGMFNVQQNAV